MDAADASLSESVTLLTRQAKKEKITGGRDAYDLLTRLSIATVAWDDQWAELSLEVRTDQHSIRLIS